MHINRLPNGLNRSRDAMEFIRNGDWFSIHQ